LLFESPAIPVLYVRHPAGHSQAIEIEGGGRVKVSTPGHFLADRTSDALVTCRSVIAPDNGALISFPCRIPAKVKFQGPAPFVLVFLRWIVKSYRRLKFDP